MVKGKHALPKEFLAIPAEKQFTEQATDQPKVYFVNYDKSQVDIFMLSKGTSFDTKKLIGSRVFNEYYGGSMSSVVFQEIREARALAYSAYAIYGAPAKKSDSFYIIGGVFTQADKMKDAMTAMSGILNNMIVDEKSFQIARESVIKSIQTERIIKTDIFWSWLANKKLGIDYDIRKDYYESAQKATIQDIQEFFNNNFKDKNYTYMMVGNKNSIDLNSLKNIGPVEELSLEQLFNY
jgi:predicted Zn-dependent peptidase